MQQVICKKLNYVRTRIFNQSPFFFECPNFKTFAESVTSNKMKREPFRFHQKNFLLSFFLLFFYLYLASCNFITKWNTRSIICDDGDQFCHFTFLRFLGYKLILWEANDINFLFFSLSSPSPPLTLLIFLSFKPSPSRSKNVDVFKLGKIQRIR